MPPCSNAHLVPGDSLVFKYQPTLLEPIKDKNATLLSETTLVAISIDSGIIIWQYSLGKPDSYNNSIRALQKDWSILNWFTITGHPTAMAGIA